LADDGSIYILRHQQAEDNWVLDSFRRGVAKASESEPSAPSISGPGSGPGKGR
jgi:hypothetical protein